ncbi:MAG: hypothetical protein QQN63_04485 [Nitrosopumilus sp.]
MAQSGFTLNNRTAINQLSRMKDLFASGIQSALTDIGRRDVKSARAMIKDKNKTGRIYIRRRGGQRIRHQASSPGQAPANFTGLLARETAFEVSGFRFMKFGNRADYSAFLELGTSQMEPRPFLIKAIKENEGYAFSALAAGPASKMGIR